MFFADCPYRWPVKALRRVVELVALGAGTTPEFAHHALLPDRLMGLAERAARREVRIVRSAVLRVLAGENSAPVCMVIVQAFA